MTSDEVQAAVLHKLVSIQTGSYNYVAWATEYYKNEPALLKSRLDAEEAWVESRERLEFERYATIHVVKRKAGWCLVYAGDNMRDATGGFPTRKLAERHFLKGGR